MFILGYLLYHIESNQIKSNRIESNQIRMVAIFVVANRSYFSIILLMLLQFQQQVVLIAATAVRASPTSQQQQSSSSSSSISSSSNNRDLQSIEDLWTMNEPNLEYVSLNSNGNKQFRLTYEVNDMIEDTMFKTTLWSTEACSSGNIPLDFEGVGYQLISTNKVPTAPGDGTGVRTFQVDFEITDEPSIRNNRNVYRENDMRILVCVRSSLETTDSIAVNYIESILQFNFIFDGGFSVGEFNISPYDEASVDVKVDAIMEAYDCTGDPIGNTRSNNGNGNSNGNNGNGNGRGGKKQGTVFRVCVQPTSDALLKGYRMQSVEEFQFETDEEEVGNGRSKIVQKAVENRGQSKKNGLTRLQCNRGQGQCIIETLLSAEFYTKERMVWAKGTVTLQLGLDDGAGNDGGNGKTSNDKGNNGNSASQNGQNGQNSNNGNNGRHLLGSVRRGLQQADADTDADELLQDVNVGMGVLSIADDNDTNENEEIYKMNNNNGWGLFSFHDSMGASLALIIFLIFNLITCLIHVIDYRKQQKTVKEMEKMSERLILSHKISPSSGLTIGMS
jgi:hypothetical protein